MTAMRTFIEDYLADPAQAVADARLQAYKRFWGGTSKARQEA